MKAGVLLVATGEKYVNEVIPLVESIRRHMPDIPIHVVTDTETNIPDGIFDDIQRKTFDLNGIPDNKSGFLFRDSALKCSKFEYTVHIDTDTYVGAPFYEVFHGLHRFELLVGAAPAKIDNYGDVSIPFSCLLYTSPSPRDS